MISNSFHYCFTKLKLTCLAPQREPNISPPRSARLHFIARAELLFLGQPFTFHGGG
jgi:hypothetical protein